MGWPPDPDEVRKHDEQAHKDRQGQKYNTPPPAPAQPATPPPAPKPAKKGGKR